jgi:hypothetical protein
MSRSCKCSDPPGGEAICEDHQMPVCVVDADGKSRQYCYDPEDRADSEELVNWALEMITEVPRTPDSFIYDEELYFLAQGRLDKDYGETITFSLPPIVRKAVDEIRQKGMMSQGV